MVPMQPGRPRLGLEGGLKAPGGREGEAGEGAEAVVQGCHSIEN